MIGLPGAKTEVSKFHLWTVRVSKKLMKLQINISRFVEFIEDYKIGLDEKLRSS
jgi:hypothetical protein